MSDWQAVLNGDPLPWLLESDPGNPSVRYLTLRDILGRPLADPDVQKAREVVMRTGPVAAILQAQHPEGYWVKEGGGYSPKYQGTVWQILLLAELGADAQDERVSRGCEYLLGHAIASNGAFSALSKPVPSGAIPCLNGNMILALQKLGYGHDPRVKAALAWQVQAVTGEGGMGYLKSGTVGPCFACSANLAQPCGWGANKVMNALLAVPPEERNAELERALQVGAEFLLSRDPAEANYPYTGRVSSTWFKFGFPLSYWSDVLETAAILTEMGYSEDPRLGSAIQLILAKQDEQGRWRLENTMDRMWVGIEKKGQPSKWVTLRALRVLKR
jgi:hypothetical protein